MIEARHLKNKYSIVISPFEKDIDISASHNDNDEKVVENILIDFHFLALCDFLLKHWSVSMGVKSFTLST